MPLRTPADFEVDAALHALCSRVEAAGGRLLVVGGWVRDALLGRPSKDIDLELHGLDADRVRALLTGVGSDVRRLDEVGRAFPVWLVGLEAGRSLEVSVATKEAGRATGSEASDAPEALHARAAARRDLRMNALGFDPLRRDLFDPFGGRADLEAGVMRCVDPLRFGEDPLRALRVPRFAAQLGFEPDAELARVCGAQSFRGVAVERVFGEWQRLLLAEDPARGLEVLGTTGVRASFPLLEALEGVPQDARWHPEGCVWTHTVMVVREAAALRGAAADARDRDLHLMWGALCHDLGKPSTTTVDADAIRSSAHDAVGEALSRDWLRDLRAPERTVDAVAALVRWHLSPMLLVAQESGDRAYRRLARRLGDAGVDAELLWRVARADHLGRTTEEALAREFSAGDVFLERMRALSIARAAPAEFVRGRDVLAAGVAAGPAVGRILARCRDIHDETGWTETARILERALAEDAAD